MIHYLLWRLRFEACNVKRLFGHGTERVQYLAFGANLSDDVLKQRRIKPFSVKHFTLRDFGLRFDHPSPWHGCGYASAEAACGESLHGFLYTLSGRDAARMDFYEVVPVLQRYRRTEVEQDAVKLYFYQTNRSTPGLKPTDEYLGFIIKGLESHPDVSPQYLEEISAIETDKPGKLVSTYLRVQSGKRTPWQRYTIDAYHRLSLSIFYSCLYRFSLTDRFIKH